MLLSYLRLRFDDQVDIRVTQSVEVDISARRISCIGRLDIPRNLLMKLSVLCSMYLRRSAIFPVP